MCICFFFSVKNVSAFRTSDSVNQSGKIAITATVLPTQEFLYLLGKNSRVSLEKDVFVPGQSVRVVAHLTTGGHDRFVEHVLVFSVINAHAEKVAGLSRSTDDSGEAVFEFTADERFLGENTVEIVDTYYGVPVVLGQSIHFIVYEEERGNTRHEKERKTVIVSGGIVLSNTSSTEVFVHNAEDLENNGTIGVQKSLSSMHIVPGDP